MEIVAPLSGTQLWADVWAVPSRTRGVQGAFMAAPSGGAFSTGGPGSSGISPLLPSWLEFCLAKGRLIGERMGTHLPAPSLCVVYIDAKRTDQYSTHSNWPIGPSVDACTMHVRVCVLFVVCLNPLLLLGCSAFLLVVVPCCMLSVGSIGLKAGAPPLLLPEAAPLGTPRPEAPHFKHR